MLGKIRRKEITLLAGMEINAPSTENTVEDLEETENKGTT